MHSLNKFLRCSKIDRDCPVVPLPDKDEEGRLYDAFDEPHGIPKPIADLVAFCDQHEIWVDVHRKPVTCGCKKAVEARSAACGVDIHLHQELKAVVLKTRENVKVAIYMSGNQELPRKIKSPKGRRSGVDCDLLSIKTGFDILGMDDDPQLISGRINPVTLFLNYNDHVEHFFDIPEHILSGPMYTNAGGNTWGIRINDVSKMLKKVGAEHLKGVCHFAQGQTNGTTIPYPAQLQLDDQIERLYA